MKALVLEENAKLVCRDIPAPGNENPDWALIRVKAAGICGSDIPRGFGSKSYHYPLVMGHEFSGVVESVPSGSDFKPGDRVVVFPLLWCGKCRYCQTGDYAQCEDYDYLGSRRDGAFAEYVKAPVENLLHVPEWVDLTHAAMAEPLAVALHGASKARVKPGDSGAVFGAGPIGNMVAQWLRISGCRDVYIVDIDSDKLALAKDMGFVPVNSASCDPVEAIKELTKGKGADRVVEAVGLPVTFLQAVKAAASFGDVVFLGNIAGEFRIAEKDFSSILRREITIHGTWNSKWVPKGGDEWTRSLAYLDRELKVDRLITHKITLEDGPEIFRKIANREEKFGKVIFTI